MVSKAMVANSVVRSQRNNCQLTWKWTTPKQVRICPKYSAIIAFLRQEDQDGTKQTYKVTASKKKTLYTFVYFLWQKTLC